MTSITTPSSCVSDMTTFPPSHMSHLQMRRIFYLSTNKNISDLTVDESTLWSLERKPLSG